MTQYECPIDNTSFDSLEELCGHLKVIRVKQQTFFEKYYFKKDLLTGTPIPFKTVEQYLNSDFLNKNNLKRWIKENPDKGIDWSIDFLEKRRKLKHLIYAPTQVELRSLQCPSMPYYESIGGYNLICAKLGYQIRFKNPKHIYNALPKDATIVCDTREQLPLNFPDYKVEFSKLDEGDYALAKPYDKKIYVERKSLLDVIGSFSKDLGRFHRELDRAREADSYIVMVVEKNINDTLGFEYLRGIPGIKYIKTNSAHIFKNIRDTLTKYINFQIIFVNGRREASKAVIKIFELQEQVKDIDLQFAYEMRDFKLD